MLINPCSCMEKYLLVWRRALVTVYFLRDAKAGTARERHAGSQHGIQGLILFFPFPWDFEMLVSKHGGFVLGLSSVHVPGQCWSCCM